jgi:hypothetical protein
MKSYFITILGLAILLTGQTAFAQEQTQTPVVLKTKADFMSHYGTTDSNRKLIQLFFNKKTLANVLAVPGGFGVGWGIGSLTRPATFTQTGLPIMAAGAAIMVPAFITDARFSHKKLIDYLEGKKPIPADIRRKRDRIVLSASR